MFKRFIRFNLNFGYLFTEINTKLFTILVHADMPLESHITLPFGFSLSGLNHASAKNRLVLEFVRVSRKF